MKKILHTPELYLILVLVLLGGILRWGFSSIDDMRVARENHWVEKTLPYSEDMRSGEFFEVKMNVHKGFFDGYSLKVNPDDCVDDFFINDTRISLDSIKGHCDWNAGFSLASEWIDMVSPGAEVTTLRFVMHNGGGPGGISVVLNADGSAGTVLSVFFLIILGILLLLVLQRFHWNKGLALLFILGVLIRIIYLQETFFDSRGHDVGGHVSYVQIIAEKHKIPGANECWTCYHPPIYYLAVAPTWNLAKTLDVSPQRFLQWDSFIFSLVALALGLLCMNMFLSGGSLYVASLLWVLWPGAVLASSRIGNDILFYLTHILCFWLCLKYLLSHQGRYLLLASLACWAAFWTKSTGLVTIGIWGLTFLLGYFPRARILPAKSEMVALILFLGLAVTIVSVHLTGSVVGNAGGLNKAIEVGNKPSNYLFFDVRSFLTEPYTSPWEDAMGRQYFWNYLAKTSLFGEFKLLTATAGLWLASIISFCFLILMGFAGVGLWKMKFSKVGLLFVGQGLLFVCAMLSLRMQYPFACSNDFRYIVPVLLSFTPLVGLGIFAENASSRRIFAGVLTAIIFAFSSFVLLASL
jgi:hypothetical protein